MKLSDFTSRAFVFTIVILLIVLVSLGIIMYNERYSQKNITRQQKALIEDIEESVEKAEEDIIEQIEKEVTKKEEENQ